MSVRLDGAVAQVIKPERPHVLETRTVRGVAQQFSAGLMIDSWRVRYIFV